MHPCRGTHDECLCQGEIRQWGARSARAAGSHGRGRFTVWIEDAPEQVSGLIGIVQRVQATQAAAPEGALDGGPSDLAQNKDHYLYGHAKYVV